jgi:peptidoglycan/LPS O-acetylase OafA/YrhL
MLIKHQDHLDGWRGVAVTSLMLGHFFPYWRLSLGLLGVNLFFVLSGLLMARLLFIKRTPIGLFYKRRISRIFPTLFVFITVVWVAYGVLGLPIALADSVGAALLVRNYYPVGFGNALPFDHIWSLSVEEHAYIVLSLVALCARAGRISGKLAVGAVVCVCVFMASWYSLTYSGADVHAQRLIRSEVSVFGIFCSAFWVLHFQQHPPREQALPVWLFVGLAAVAVLMHYFSLPRFFTLVFGVGALALLINLMDRAPPFMRRMLSLAPLRQLGLWSFSIYLWQQPFYVLKDKHVLSAPVAFGCAMLAGVLSFYLIENPARRFLNRVWAKDDGAAAPAMAPA